jgi:hypothetical protein
MATRGPIAFAVLLACLVIAAVAGLEGQTQEPPGHAAPAASKPSGPRPDISAIVERIQKRIDNEVAKPAAARPTPSTKPSARTAQPRAATTRDGRIRLTWRVSLIWPQELVAER